MGVNAETTYPAILGRIIAQKRQDKCMDQEQAAKRAEINRSSWSRIENGDTVPDAIQLTNIANALGCSPAEIMTLADNARTNMEKSGIKVHMAAAKSKKSSSGILALLGVAALGAFVIAATKADSDPNKK